MHLYSGDLSSDKIQSRVVIDSVVNSRSTVFGLLDGDGKIDVNAVMGRTNRRCLSQTPGKCHGVPEYQFRGICEIVVSLRGVL